MPERINFTRDGLKRLSLPRDGARKYVYDTRVRGLAVQVTPAGTITFYLVRKVKATGKTQRIRLGLFEPDSHDSRSMTIEQARTQVEHLNREIANRVDVVSQRKAELAANAAKKEPKLTFGKLFEMYMELYAKHQTKTWPQSEEIYKRHFSIWHTQPPSAITKAELQHWVVRLSCSRDHRHVRDCNTQRKHAANRSFNLFRAVWNWAIKKDFIPTQHNPCIGIDMFAVKARERFIQPGDEYGRVVTAIHAETDSVVRDYFLLLLETAARRNNVLCMSWKEISFELRIWTITDTKNDDTQTIPLTDQAIAILESRRRESEKNAQLIQRCGEDNVSKWVFPSTGRTGHLKSPFKCWKRIRERAGAPDLRIHDIRRTVGSYLASQGQSSFIIAKTLGHKSLDATKVYARMNLDPVREALEKIKVLAQAKVSSDSAGDSKIVNIARKRKK